MNQALHLDSCKTIMRISFIDLKLNREKCNYNISIRAFPIGPYTTRSRWANELLSSSCSSQFDSYYPLDAAQEVPWNPACQSIFLSSCCASWDLHCLFYYSIAASVFDLRMGTSNELLPTRFGCLIAAKSPNAFERLFPSSGMKSFLIWVTYS